MRKIIRHSQWATLRRKAKDAVYPNPPEAVPFPLTEGTPRTVFEKDQRLFIGIVSVTLRGKELLDSARDPAIRLYRSEQADYVVQMLNTGHTQQEALNGLDDISHNPKMCRHYDHRDDRAVASQKCRCDCFCSCRLSGLCEAKYPVRFAEPAKLLRQWNQEMFDLSTAEVSSLLSVDEFLAESVCRWARVRHPAWTVRHGESLVALEEFYGRQFDS